MLKKYSKTVKQFGKFAVVGVLNTAVDLVVLTVLIMIEPSGKAGLVYAVFKAIAFVVANINSYIFNKFWTFKGEGGQKKTTFEFSQYFIISIIGMLINVSVATAVATYFTLYEYYPSLALLENPWPQIAALFGTAGGLLWNFVGYKYIVFVGKDKKKTAHDNITDVS